MGPLITRASRDRVVSFVDEAVDGGATAVVDGRGLTVPGHEEGFFVGPTVLADVPLDARAMNEEPFGPMALIRRFSEDDEALAEANRLPFGLAAYAYTRSAARAARLGSDIESGMVSINHHGIALPETPFGGMKESGYGSEGGVEGLDAYLATKFVTQANV